MYTIQLTILGLFPWTEKSADFLIKSFYNLLFLYRPNDGSGRVFVFPSPYGQSVASKTDSQNVVRCEVISCYFVVNTVRQS